MPAQAAADAAADLDPALRAYALRSAPTPAPRPQPQPMGVEALPTVTDATRRAANDAAAKIAGSEGKLTPKAYDLLRQWSGEGGLGGSANAFYTPGRIVKAAWDIAMTLDPKIQRVLEFSVGGGAFLAHAPKGTLLTGVELDETSARVAQTLFPHATIHHVPFETYATRSEDRPFDLVIGNPPYGPRGAQARLHRPDLDKAHWYFLHEGLRRVRPGGLMAVVIPESMLRNPSEAPQRESLLRAAHLIGAYAIPERAFHDTGAGVTTALLILRRHDAGVTEALGALSAAQASTLLDAWMDDAARTFVNGTILFHEVKGTWHFKYTFHALGERHAKAGASLRPGRYGDPAYDAPLLTSDAHLTDITDAAAKRWHGLLTRTQLAAAASALIDDHAAQTIQNVRPHPHPIRDGRLSDHGEYRFTAGQWRYASALHHPETRSALDVARAIVTARRDRSPTTLAHAHAAHARHLATHGAYTLDRLTRALNALPILAVITDAHGDVPRVLSDVQQRDPVLHGQTLPALARELESYGLLTPDALAQHARVPRAAAHAHLLAEYAYTGTTWESNATYYQGPAITKARAAQALIPTHTGLERDALTAQAARLWQAAPTLDITDMTLDPRDPLIPAPIVQAWLNTFLGTRITTRRNPYDEQGQTVDAVLLHRDPYGVTLALHQTFDAQRQLTLRHGTDPTTIRRAESYLNNRTTIDPVPTLDADGQPRPPEAINAERNANQLNAVTYEKTAAASFRAWLLDSPHAPTVQAILNEHRYALLHTPPDTTPLPLDAYHGPEAHPFQAGHVRALARMSGAILNFDVGLGKTLTAMMLIALLRQSGRARLPALVVELSRLGDFIMNAATALPTLRAEVIGATPARHPDGTFILGPDGEPLTRPDDGHERRAKVAGLIATPPDLVIFTYEAFEAIGMLLDTHVHFITTDPTAMSGVTGSSTYDERGRKLSGHKAATEYERALQKHLARVPVAGPNDVPFEALGIDAVIIDEGHRLKNLAKPPTVYGESAPKFLGGAESNRARDAHHKLKFVRAQGGLTVLMTATWFQNSPAEIFAMLSQVTDQLPHYGVTDLASFVARYVVIEPRMITTPAGTVEYAACVVGFTRLDELRTIAGQHVIRETEDTCLMPGGVTGMPLPPLHTTEHLFDLPDDVQAIYDANQLDVHSVESHGERHLFSIFARLMKLTLHPPLMGLNAPSRRFQACVQQCLHARARGGRNLIFMYTGGEGGQAYTDLRDMLIHAGYPPHEIQIVTATTCPDSSDRLTAERRFRRGELTLVIASELWEKGANLQGGTDIHHLDYPHHHQAFHQRIGRVRRQGTTVTAIHNHLYFARGSFDLLRYQGMLGKRGWSDQFYDPTITTCENTNLGFNGEEIAVMLARDPDAMRHAIAQQKERRRAEASAATLTTDLETMREYLHTIRLLKRRHAESLTREHGPSRNDHTGIARLLTRLRLLDTQVQTLRDHANPLAALSRITLPLHWYGGLPFHPGMTLTHKGTPLTVQNVTDDALTVQVTTGTGTDTLNTVQLGIVSALAPTTDPAAYGPEAITTLPKTLRDRLDAPEPPTPATTPIQAPPIQVPIQVPEVTPVQVPEATPVQVLPVQVPVQVPEVTPVQATPLRGAVTAGARFGVSVTRQVPQGFRGQTFTVHGNALTPGAQAGGPHLLIEYRPTGDVRQVTLVLTDETAYARTRALLLERSERLRQRVETLLATAA